MNQPKIIIPTGYMGSGSSAITDLLREYPCLNTKNADFEYIFLHAPDGLFDLEKKLLENNNAIRSDEAIKAFRTLMEKLFTYRGWWPAGYNRAVSEEFLKIVEEYLTSISTVKFEGNWYIYDRPSYIIYLIRAILNRIGKLVKYSPVYNKKKTVLEISLIEDAEFYHKSRIFIENVISQINKNNQDIVLDQLLLPHNLKGFEKYQLQNVYPIIIERDPRDVFISNKYFWEPSGNEVPYPLDVNEFCKYYKAIRKAEKGYTSNYLRLNFEDLILNYDSVVEKIELYLDLKKADHKLHRVYLDPDKSKNNLKLYSRNHIYKEEINIINRELEEFLYDFPEDFSQESGEVF